MKRTFILLAITIFPISIFAQSYAVDIPGRFNSDLGVTISDGNITEFHFGRVYERAFYSHKNYDFTDDNRSYECSENDNCKISLSKNKRALIYSYKLFCHKESSGENYDITATGNGYVTIKYIFTLDNESVTYDKKEIYLMKKQNDGSYVDNCYGQYKIASSQIVNNSFSFIDEYNRKISGNVTEDEGFYLYVTTSDDPKLQEVEIEYPMYKNDNTNL